MAKSTVGAKCKLTDDLIENACELLARGNYDKTVYRYLGIGEASWFRYINRGEEDFNNGKDTVYAKFYIQTTKARAQSEIRNVGVIQQAAENDWKASAWFLERKFAARWGRRDKTEFTGKDGGPIEIANAKESLLKKLTELSEEEKNTES